MPDVTILIGDAREQLATLPAESVHCVVTSPPYWGLRDYGVEGQLGLEPTVDLYVEHMVEVFREVRRVLRADGTLWLNMGDCYASSPPGNKKTGLEKWKSSGLHGAVTSERYAATLDASVGKKRNTVGNGLKPKDLVGQPWRLAFALQADGWWLRGDNIWHKLNPMPESVKDRPTKAHEYVFLLTKSGTPQYWVHPTRGGCRKKPRPDYRWTDRETGAVVTKPPKDWKTDELPDGRKRWSRANLWRAWDYFYDQEAVREPSITGDPRRPYGSKGALDPRGMNAQGNGQLRQLGPKGTQADAATRSESGGRMGRGAGWRDDPTARVQARNLRSVWTIPTQPFPGAHFACFPEALVTPCIRAGTSAKGCCAACGAPWVRVVERATGTPDPARGWDTAPGAHGREKRRKHPQTNQRSGAGRMSKSVRKARTEGGSHDNPWPAARTTGWLPSCDCAYDEIPDEVLKRGHFYVAGWMLGTEAPRRHRPVPCTVLDPFGGSGTTGLVAAKLERKAILIELNPKYAEMARQRTNVDVQRTLIQ